MGNASRIGAWSGSICTWVSYIVKVICKCVKFLVHHKTSLFHLKNFISETSPGAVFFSPGTGVPYTYHNGMAVFEYPHLAAQAQVLILQIIMVGNMYLVFMLAVFDIEKTTTLNFFNSVLKIALKNAFILA